MSMKVGAYDTPLPKELVMEIFSWLPVKQLLRSKCVSKSCYKLITSPQFVKLHLSRSLDRNSGVICLFSVDSFLASFDFHHPQRPAVQLHHPNIVKEPENKYSEMRYLFDEIVGGDFVHPAEIVGISNGVVCFSKADEFVLYNPATRTSKQVSRPQVKVSPGCYQDEFGYDCIGDDYKILSVANLFKTDMRLGYITETNIYSLKSNSWERIENPPWGGWVIRSRSVVANNSFYWITCDHSDNQVITCFDLCSQTYGEMPFPPNIKCLQRELRLGVLKGRLHAILNIGIRISLWMLKEDHEWSRLCPFLHIEPVCRNRCWPLLYAYSKDESKILVGLEETPRDFVCCDLNSQTITTVEVLGLPKDASFTASPWTESLVPLG